MQWQSGQVSYMRITSHFCKLRNKGDPTGELPCVYIFSQSTTMFINACISWIMFLHTSRKSFYWLLKTQTACSYEITTSYKWMHIDTRWYMCACKYRHQRNRGCGLRNACISTFSKTAPLLCWHQELVFICTCLYIPWHMGTSYSDNPASIGKSL